MKKVIRIALVALITFSNFTASSASIYADEDIMPLTLMTICPSCGGDAEVTSSRITGYCTLNGESYTIYRYYFECTNCGYNWNEEVKVRDN